MKVLVGVTFGEDENVGPIVVLVPVCQVMCSVVWQGYVLTQCLLVRSILLDED